LQLRYSGSVLDAMGYGSFAASDVFAGEGAAVADEVAPGQSVGRSQDGADTDDNGADFAVLSAPSPGAPNAP
jgi:hypothetical protein